MIFISRYIMQSENVYRCLNIRRFRNVGDRTPQLFAYRLYTERLNTFSDITWSREFTAQPYSLAKAGFFMPVHQIV